MERAVGPVRAPGRLRCNRPGRALGDAVTVGVGRRETREAGPRPRIERHAECGRERPGAERPDDLDVGRGEAVGKPLEFAQQDTASSGVRSLLPARALDLSPRQPCVDLQADEELVIRRDRRRGARQLEVRLHRYRVDRRRVSIPRLAEVPADLVAVCGHGALDPLDPADRRSFACEPGEYTAPARLAAFLLAAIEEPERGDLDRQRRGVGARPAVLDHADLLPLERRRKQFEVASRVGQFRHGLRPAAGPGLNSGLRRRRDEDVLPDERVWPRGGRRSGATPQRSGR